MTSATGIGAAALTETADCRTASPESTAPSGGYRFTRDIPVDKGYDLVVAGGGPAGAAAAICGAPCREAGRVTPDIMPPTLCSVLGNIDWSRAKKASQQALIEKATGSALPQRVYSDRTPEAGRAVRHPLQHSGAEGLEEPVGCGPLQLQRRARARLYPRPASRLDDGPSGPGTAAVQSVATGQPACDLDTAALVETVTTANKPMIDKDAHGNPSCAWSSPIWVNSLLAAPTADRTLARKAVSIYFAMVISQPLAV